MQDDILHEYNAGIRLKQRSKLVSINKRATCALTCKDQREIDEITNKYWPQLLQEYDFHVENQNINEIQEITNLMVQVQNYLAEISISNYIEAPINRLPRLISSFDDNLCLQYFRFRSRNDLVELKNALFPEAVEYGQHACIVISETTRNTMYLEEMLLLALNRYAHGTSYHMQTLFNCDISVKSRAFKYFNNFMLHRYGHLVDINNLHRWRYLFDDWSKAIATKMAKNQYNPRINNGNVLLDNEVFYFFSIQYHIFIIY